MVIEIKMVRNIILLNKKLLHEWTQEYSKGWNKTGKEQKAKLRHASAPCLEGKCSEFT